MESSRIGPDGISVYKTLPGPVLNDWTALGDVVQGALLDGFDVTIDLNGVERVTPAALSRLLDNIRCARTVHRTVRVANPCPSVQRRIELIAVRPLNVISVASGPKAWQLLTFEQGPYRLGVCQDHEQPGDRLSVGRRDGNRSEFDVTKIPRIQIS
jgi:ABC-type transporter Mla MlaB component